MFNGASYSLPAPLHDINSLVMCYALFGVHLEIFKNTQLILFHKYISLCRSSLVSLLGELAFG